VTVSLKSDFNGFLKTFLKQNLDLRVLIGFFVKKTTKTKNLGFKTHFYSPVDDPTLSSLPEPVM